jgi:putative nucleotidyltransferase with HDIG domain
MDFDQARALMESQISEETLRKHCLASAAVCRALARRLEEDEELWAVTGLLHDLDFEQTKDNPSQHGVVAAEILEKEGLPAEAITAIKAHNAELTGVERTTPLDFALTAGETITGLVVATTLVYPDKKLASVKPKSVTKRMKEKAFARAVKRENILLCEKLDIPMPEFSALAVEAMRGISDELGL